MTWRDAWRNHEYKHVLITPFRRIIVSMFLIFAAMSFVGCTDEGNETMLPERTAAPVSRSSAIPESASKISPAQDSHAPVLHSDLFLEPLPLEGPINTAGAEDSPFISPDGSMLFFFFTPDVDVPPEGQLLDRVTGIYLSRKTGQGWTQPERVLLQDEGKLALDGCGFFDGNTLWFCSAREGYTGLQWFKADLVEGQWVNWRSAGFDPSYEVGELHIHADELYFHSDRDGGQGGMDLWKSAREAGGWGPPQNLTRLNSDASEGYPFVTADGNELWFTRWYQGTPAIYRSVWIIDDWGEPELIVSQFAGEPTLDPDGNLYFVHHYYRDGEMIEADIYVAERRQP